MHEIKGGGIEGVVFVVIQLEVSCIKSERKKLCGKIITYTNSSEKNLSVV